MRMHEFCACQPTKPSVHERVCAQAVSAYVPVRIADFTTQAVSNTIWGCSVLNYYDSDLYATVAEELSSPPLAALQSPYSCQRSTGIN